MTLQQRDHVITVRMSREERDKLQALADDDGISVSDVVRMVVRRTHAERFGDKKTKARR